MLTVAELLDELKLMPPEATVEVWYPADTRGTYDVDVDVRLLPIHDHDQQPVAIAICATRPLCARTAVFPIECWTPADVELTDRTGHRHPLCATHTLPAWDDPMMRVTAVYGGPGAPGWTIAAQLLQDRWGNEPDVAAWAAHPAPWTAPLPHQPAPAAA